MLLEIGLEAAQDLDRVLDTGLVDVDLLKAPHQRPVLLEVAAVLLVGGGADAAHHPALQGRLEDVGGVHGAAAGGAGSDHRMDLVDEEDRPRHALELGDHRLEPFLEIAAVAGAGEQRSQVEGVDRALGEHLRHLPHNDAPRQTLGEGGLADTGVADEQRVVLVAAAEDLDGALDLLLAADERVDAALEGLLVEVDAIGLERLVVLLHHLLGLGVLVGAVHRARPALARHLGDAVGDVVDRVQPRHVLQLEEVDGVGLPLGEERHQHVRAGHLLASRGLDVDDGALDHSLEGGRRPRLADTGVADVSGQLGVHVLGEDLSQLLDVDAARAQHGDRVLVLGQRQQQVLQGRVLVAALGGQRQRPMQSLFQLARQHDPSRPRPSPWCTGADADAGAPGPSLG